ncbi:MAG TPA: septum site-determining protein MinC [Firmicutes bacterium]|jgi:septum site-determining protein MinC|nr:septum site-determining protein MinC [Bacillota bacterium]
MLSPASKSLRDEQLVFKGLKQGLTLFIPEKDSFLHWLEVLDRQLNQARGFFQGGTILVELGARKLAPGEMAGLKRVLAKYRMRIKAFNPLEIKRFDSSSPEQPSVPCGVLLVKQTVRSGQRLEHEGDLVVKGDLNPGGEIVATGDIIVLGALRGIAHAGARGNRQAEIVAFTLAPVQLRIAHLISRAPEERKGRQGPVVASVKGEKIVVERL